MANFPPMKRRFQLVLGQSLERLGIRGRFLDYGCGSGDVGEYLVTECDLPGGVGYDPALSDEEIERRNLRSGGRGLVYTDRLEEVGDGLELCVLFDVIEHLPDTAGTLREIHGLVEENGWLAITVPYNSHEWGVDDEFYGHLRRLSRQGIISLLENNGWHVVRVLDPTFPTFWLIRRLYLLMARFSDRFHNVEQQQVGTDMDRTLASSRQSSWDAEASLPKALVTNILPWRLIRMVDLYFESVCWGFELFVVAQKRSGERTCEVCANGLYTFHKYFDRYAVQRCHYCRSEKILPERPNRGYLNAGEKLLPAGIGRLLAFLQRGRVKLLEKLHPPERSLLDVRCGDGTVPAYFKAAGWRAVGTAASERSEQAARERGAEVLRQGLLDVSAEEPFGVVSLFHVIEHTPNLHQTLDHLDRLVLPGGYLVLEYPNGRSWLKALLQWRWFGYDPPYHRLQINPLFLADYLGVRNFRLLRESHFSLEYSFFIFAQSLVNALLPFQRDALYKLLCGRETTLGEKISAVASVPLVLLSAPLFALYQPLASLARRGCIVRQVFKKTDIL